MFYLYMDFSKYETTEGNYLLNHAGRKQERLHKLLPPTHVEAVYLALLANVYSVPCLFLAYLRKK